MGSDGMTGSSGTEFASSNASATLTTASGEEAPSNVDEPPDEQTIKYTTISDPLAKPVLRFGRSLCCEQCPKLSLLTQALTSDESHDEENISQLHSNASLSSAELTSDAGATSMNSRTQTPSPPLPPMRLSTFNPFFGDKLAEPKIVADGVKGLTRPTVDRSKFATEADLGKRRCIRFACADVKSTEKEEAKAEPLKTQPNASPPAFPKRGTTLTFVCQPKEEDDVKSRKVKCRTRVASPAPRRRVLSPPCSPNPLRRNHRSSDSTAKNDSPKSIRPNGQKRRSRNLNVDSDLTRSSAYRFHEFASSEEEIDDWVQESTCHRSRLTIDDTLTVENGLRKLGQEVEEEALEDEDDITDEDEGENNENDEDEDEGDVDEDEDEDDDSEDGDENEDENPSEQHENEAKFGSRGVATGDKVSDGGFQTDDEKGFADSDDETFDDAHSDYEWWAPTRAVTNAPSHMDDPVHIRPSSSRRISNSSAGSFFDDSLITQPSYSNWIAHKPGKEHTQEPLKDIVIQQNLPDSTDFVCGTLDEDRPLEDAFKKRLEMKRIESHRTVPQDIDPTFPTSDVEVDEEDMINSREDEQDVLPNGQLDLGEENVSIARPANPRNTSSYMRSRRLHSPAPTKRFAAPFSPSTRKCGMYSPKRCRSPPPSTRHSRPVTPRRQVMDCKHHKKPTIRIDTAVSQRPHITRTSSLPRTPVLMSDRFGASDTQDEDSEVDERAYDSNDRLAPGKGRKSRKQRRRGAIDIVKGLERKRQYRKEKLYQKRCREIVNNRDNRDRDRNKQHNGSNHDATQLKPGKGVEKMRELGIELASCGKGRHKNPLLPIEPAQHILSI